MEIERGDMVKLKGRAPFGILKTMSAGEWCVVDWQSAETGPKYVGLKELERYTEKEPSK